MFRQIKEIFVLVFETITDTVPWQQQIKKLINEQTNKIEVDYEIKMIFIKVQT